MQLLRNPYINPANLLTAANLLLGFISIVLSLSGKIHFAAFALIVAMLFDFLDGFVARLMKTEGELGKQLDSLADIVSFGVAPGIILFVMIVIGVDLNSLNPKEISNSFCPINYDEFVRLKISQWTDAMFYNTSDAIGMSSGCPISLKNNPYDASIKYLPFVALCIPICSMFRLAKFNVDLKQVSRFSGLATPFMTFIILFFPLQFSTNMENWFDQPNWVQTIFDCYFVASFGFLLSILMIMPVPLISLKFKSFSFKKNAAKYLFLLTSLISILLFHIWSIPIILILYLTFSLGDIIFLKNEV